MAAIDRYRNNSPATTVTATVVTYAVWFFFGMFGGHRFITGRVGSGLTMLGLHALGWLTWWLGVGFLILGFVGLWWLIDALLIPGWLRDR